MNPPKQLLLSALRGMRDILPEEAGRLCALEKILYRWVSDYGYERIIFPIIESTHLFLRSIGENTDIVEKEMFTFTDSLNGKSVTLRPEGTASCLRAAIENHLLYNQPTKRLWYLGSMFRHERPQKGRYREFQQIGIEALGFSEPCVDAELILMVHDLWGRLGILDKLELQVNSIGSSFERRLYREALVTYFQAHQNDLDEDSQRRLKTNPLRILDSKNPVVQAICTEAPKLRDYLGKVSQEHYQQWKKMLETLRISYTENPHLVRGLDYYNLSVFEWVSASLGAQGAVCAGGRYDGLMQELGGRPTPAVGLAIGLERLMLLLDKKVTPMIHPDIYLIHKGQGTSFFALEIAKKLRQAAYRVLQHGCDDKFAYQFKQANLSQARFAIVIGENEVAANTVTIKPLLEDKAQQTVKQVDMISALASLSVQE